MPANTTLREIVQHLRDGEPGRRFVDAYEFRKTHPPHPALRVALWVLALALIAGGVAISWVPGPGGCISILGLAVFAMEMRPVAVLLDKVELWLRHAWEWLRRHRRSHHSKT